MILFYVGLENDSNQATFSESETGGGLCMNLSDVMNKFNECEPHESVRIVEIEVSDKDLVEGLNSAMSGNSWRTFRGCVIRTYKPEYNKSTMRWELTI